MGKCFHTQMHFYYCGMMQESEFQHSQMDFHFGSWANLSLPMVPLGTSHPKFLQPIQLYGNIELTLKNNFILSYLSKGYPSHVKFETLIKFTKKKVF